jgi:RNA polymerase sigma-70 factor (ECF subfamily)
MCMTGQKPEPGELQLRAAAGDAEAWGSLLMLNQDRLRRMVAFRMDPRLRGRVDAADVVQEVFLEASAHRERFFREEMSVSLFLWLRGVVANKLLEIHRHHLGTRMRDAAREAAPNVCAIPDATSVALVAQLTGHATGPGTAAAGAEVKGRLQETLSSMDPVDREALALRHFELLTNVEAAQVLGIQKDAAAKRYIRALKRLRKILADMPGGLTGLRP